MEAALEAGEAGCWLIELFGVMTRNRFLGKKRTIQLQRDDMT